MASVQQTQPSIFGQRKGQLIDVRFDKVLFSMGKESQDGKDSGLQLPQKKSFYTVSIHTSQKLPPLQSLQKYNFNPQPFFCKMIVFLVLLQIYQWMQDHGSISKLRECFNQSTFFSTQVSSPSRSLLNNESIRLTKMPSKFTDDPQVYLRKIKIKKKEATEKCLQALRGTVKAKLDLQRVEREAAISRYDFMRLYNTKKFRLDQKLRLSSHRNDYEFNLKLSCEKTKQQRVLGQLSLTTRRQQQMRNIQNLFQANRHNKSIFRETLRASQEREHRWVQTSAEKVKKERANFQIRKKNLAQLNTTKSKLNYLSKINEEMQAIKQYQQMVDNIKQDPQYQQQFQHHSSRQFRKKQQSCQGRFASTFTATFH